MEELNNENIWQIVGIMSKRLSLTVRLFYRTLLFYDRISVLFSVRPTRQSFAIPVKKHERNSAQC